MKEESKSNTLTALVVAQVIAGIEKKRYIQEVRRSEFDMEPTVSKPHNHPEPKEHTHGLEPKPRSKRKVAREKMRNGETPDYWLQEERNYMSKCKEQAEEVSE